MDVGGRWMRQAVAPTGRPAARSPRAGERSLVDDPSKGGSRASAARRAASRSQPGRRPHSPTGRARSGAARSSRSRRRSPTTCIPGIDPGPEDGDLVDADRQRRRASGGRSRARCRTAGPPSSGGATRGPTARTRRAPRPAGRPRRRGAGTGPRRARGSGRRRPPRRPGGARAATRSASACQPVVAMTNARQPASSAGLDVRGDRVAARRIDDDVGAAPRIVGSCRPPVGRPSTRTVVVAAAQRRVDRPPERAVAENDRGCHRAFLLVWSRSRRTAKEARNHEAAVTAWCRGPWSLRARRLLSVFACAPSEPQGPCLPAGPPELLLGLVGHEDAAHVHILHAGPELATGERLRFGAMPGEASDQVALD